MRNNLKDAIPAQTEVSLVKFIFNIKAKMPGVVKKTKSKAAKKVSPVKEKTKFVTESVSFTM